MDGLAPRARALDGNLDVAAVKLMTTPSFQNMLFVEIPEYRNKHVRTSVKVNFYVINGKRKRSQPQHFTYHPGRERPEGPVVGRQCERVGEDPAVCCWLGSLGLVVPPARFPHYHLAPSEQGYRSQVHRRCPAQRTGSSAMSGCVVSISLWEGGAGRGM